jgi:hypothetical protein
MCTGNRSNKLAAKCGTGRGGTRSGCETYSQGPHHDGPEKDQKKSDAPPPTLSGAPDPAIELKVKKHPDDEDAKADLGSDESMDASDPSAAAQPGNTNEPAPSSGFPEKPQKK